ncbi:MAG: hypothetical protein K9K68_00325 [Methylococcaceae bacterium]|nr:hypothetical protein [Methylococcaceae bacterium]
MPTAGADIQDSDFRFHDEGQAIFINGKKGAPLHIDYIGPALTKSLKVRITPTNPALKVNPSVCTFSKKDDVEPSVYEMEFIKGVSGSF